MCGIVGVIGEENVGEILLEGLSRLEYRGYDSSGIAVKKDNNEIITVKSKGKLENLFNKTDGGKYLSGICGIGHTRWATHGEPTEINAHPHMSDDGKVIGVHNGIIENYKALKLGIAPPQSGELIGWAKQGVLLLNTTLTVREGTPQSHKGKGWEILTDRIISLMNDKTSPVVFILWGGNARAKKSLITNPIHLVLECAHPSPRSAYAGFFSCGHFIKANAYLQSKGIKLIEWDKINDI